MAGTIRSRVKALESKSLTDSGFAPAWFNADFPRPDHSHVVWLIIGTFPNNSVTGDLIIVVF